MSSVIGPFRDSGTEALYRAKRLSSSELFEGGVAQARHQTRLDDFASATWFPLEALKGDRHGQHSIRIIDQWRICPVWRQGGAELVRMADHH